MITPLNVNLVNVGSNVKSEMMTAAKEGGRDLMSNIAKSALQGNKIRSLADVGKSTRVEPLVLIDDSLKGQLALEDIMKSALSIFTGYYLQAASAMISINRVETMRVLDVLNPNRSMDSVRDQMGSKSVDYIFAREAYKDGLPSFEDYEDRLPHNVIVAVESVSDDAGKKDDTKKPEGLTSGGVSDDSVKRLTEVESLAVGKMVSIEFKENGDSVKIPVLIRLIPTYVPTKILTHIFTATARNASFKERWYLWRAGQIRFIRDLIFSVDIIDEHRKALINDTSNVYATITDRRRANVTKSMATGNPSMADASNIAIISKTTAKNIGRALYGKLEDLKTRKAIFDSTYLMLLVVVDDEWERVTIFHRGLDQPTELSFKEIKNAEKGKGPDITEILRAYQMGTTPTL